MLPCAPPRPWPSSAPPSPRRRAPPAPPARAAKRLFPRCAPSGRSHPGRDTRSVRRPGRASAKPGSLPPAAPPGGSPRSSTAAPEPAAERAPRECAACSRPTDTRPAPPARLPASSAGSQATVGSAIPARFRPASSTALAARRRPRLLPQHQPPRLAAVAIAAPARRALGARRSQRILHFLLQNLRDEFAHPLPQPLLQTLPPGIPLLLVRSEEHTSELQSRQYLVCRLLLEKK